MSVIIFLVSGILVRLRKFLFTLRFKKINLTEVACVYVSVHLAALLKY